MRILVTGGSGVLGRALTPLLEKDGHDVIAPGSKELDLFDESGLKDALNSVEAVYHLATRIPPLQRQAEPGAWDANDRLRTDATRVLVEAALANDVGVFVLPSVAFLYPAQWPADETTPIVQVPDRLRSVVDAEEEVRRFGEAGRRGIIMRLGLLWGPGTGNDQPVERYSATLHVEDAGSALRDALELPGGVYNVAGDGQRVANARFKAATGWQPRF